MPKQSQGAWWIRNNYPPAMMRSADLMRVDNLYTVYYNDLLSCCMQVLIFENLPKSIDPTWFKFCLLLAGRVAVFRDTKGSGDICALDCAIAGEPDIYYMPQEILIVNPAFRGYSYTLKREGPDVAVIFCRECDRYQWAMNTGGLYGLISTTAQMLADNAASINVATKNMRLTNILAADKTNTKNSIDLAMQKMYDGEPTIVVQKSLAEKLETIPLTEQTNTQQLLQLLQTRQYIYAHFYEQIGLKTHDQMKKERLITAEIDEGGALAVFNVTDMLQSITRGIEEMNEKFGTNVLVRLHPLIETTVEPPQAEPAAADTGAAAAPVPEPEREPDILDAIYAAAADRVAEMIRTAGRSDAQTGDGEDDAQSDGSDDDAQTGDGEDDAQSDGSDDDAQTGDGEDDAQSDGSGAEIDVSGITIDAGGDVSIIIDSGGGGSIDT